MTVEADSELAQVGVGAAQDATETGDQGVETAAGVIEAADKKEKPDHPFQVEVLYNGVKKPFEVRGEQLVKSLLEKAVQRFGTVPNPHTLSLFNKAGEELPDDRTLEAAGVKPGDVLLLRPSQVKGGR